ncbi:MAG: hypothetical protein IJI58_01800 [Bacilli bacterium]|nr:hypothetical protein [Bacilli bacterium]
MASVDWITWKTDAKELINSEQIEEVLTKKANVFNNSINNVYNSIKIETEKGGLNKESLSINGESPSNIAANKILKRIENIKVLMDKFNNKISTQVAEQKKIEKEQLITAIEEKIDEQERILQNTMSLRNRISTNNQVVDINDVNAIINVTNEKIAMLKERLEKAKAI